MHPAVALLLMAGGLGDAAPERVRTYDLRHVRADLSFDLDAGEVKGVARLSIEPLTAGTPIRLDAEGLLISSVRAAGLAVRYHLRGGMLEFDPPHRGPFEVTIRYQAKPRRGLYFLRDGGKVRQIYTQGFPNDNHHWIPLYDFPNDKTTSELYLTVPPHWTTVSNGALAGVKEDGASKIWHWKLDRPQSTYLISFVAGEMECLADGRLEYCMPPSQGRHAKLSFGRTPDAMRFFEERLGPFPWPRYSQIVLHDAIYSGMENTGAVTYAPEFLLTPELAPDFQQRNDATIAHELAHQWFGDSVSFADFRHIWLSEGFATGLANIWIEHYYGPEAAAARREQARLAIVSTPATLRYPLVRRDGVATDPVSLLAYQKGGWIVHMLRRHLGDAEFWRVMRRWYESKAYANATTDEFKRAVGERGNVIFEQYLDRPGHPVWAVDWRWRDGTVTIAVEQKAELFRLPVTVDIDGDRHTIEIGKQREDFTFVWPSTPRRVRIDPDGDWLADISITPAESVAAPRPADDETLRIARTDPSWTKRAQAVRRAASIDGTLWTEFIAVDSPREMIREAVLQAFRVPSTVLAQWAAPGKPINLRVAAIATGRVPSAIRAAASDENHRIRMAAASAMARRKDRAGLRRLAADPLDLVAEHARELLR